jgi:hypothetical protein
MGCIQAMKETGDLALSKAALKNRKYRPCHPARPRAVVASVFGKSGSSLRHPKTDSTRTRQAISTGPQNEPGTAPEWAADMLKTAKAMLKISMAPMSAAIEA